MADIAFIVPVYKISYGMLRQCVDSIVDQTYRNIEIILVDDGSPDDGGKICDERAKLDPRVKVVHKPNGGLSSARNAGLAICTSPWVAFVDADDWVDLDFAESFLDRVKEQETRADFYIYNQYRNFETKEIAREPHYEDGVRFEKYGERERLQTDCLLGPTKANGKKPFIGHAWAKVFSRAFLEENGLTFIEVPYSEDLLFFFYTVERARVVEYVTKPVYHYRYVDDSMVNRYNPDADQEEKILLEKIFEFAERYGKRKKFIERLYLQVFKSMRRCVYKKYYHENYPTKGLRRFLECEKLFRQEPYRNVYRYVKFLELDKSNRITYILLRSKLYGLYMETRRLYRKICRR